MKTAALVLAFALVSSAARAADQTFTLDAPPKFLDVSQLKDAKGNPLVDPNDGSIKVENASSLIAHLFDGKNAPAEKMDHPFVIHSLVWNNKNGTQVVGGADHWYVYDPTVPRLCALAEFLLNSCWTQKRL